MFITKDTKRNLLCCCHDNNSSLQKSSHAPPATPTRSKLMGFSKEMFNRFMLRLVLGSFSTVYYMTSSASRQDEPNLALWLATRAGKMELSCPLGIRAMSCKEHLSCYVWVIDQTWGQDGWILAKFFFCVFARSGSQSQREIRFIMPARGARHIIRCFIPYNKSFIDQACWVKMAGYWSRSFFACLWTETSS